MVDDSYHGLPSLKARVLATLSYSAIFSFPLTITEVYQRLLAPAGGLVVREKTVQLGQVAEALEQLAAEGLVVSKQQYWFLVGSSAEPIQRQGSAQHSRQKMQLVKDELWPRLRWIPWLKAVGVTGSVSVQNASPDDDIDVIMVAKEGRLWLVRLMVLLAVAGSGRRRPWQAAHSGRSVTNTWCFNLWLSDSALAVPWSEQDVYSAYEVLQVKWLAGRAKAAVQRDWYQANKWVASYVPHLYTTLKKSSGESDSSSGSDWLTRVLRPVSWAFNIWWGSLNWLAFWVQHFYMRPHMTTERVDLESAYFHPRPTRAWVAVAWVGSMTQASDVKVVLATGVFDLLHQEHVRFLQKAAAEGDVLVVGVESDQRVRAIKGPDRPVFSQAERRNRLRQLDLVDLGLILPAEFNQEGARNKFVQLLKPDVLAVSSHSHHLAAKREIMQRHGGEVVVVHDHNPAVSTSLLLSQKNRTSEAV